MSDTAKQAVTLTYGVFYKRHFKSLMLIIHQTTDLGAGRWKFMSNCPAMRV